MSFEQTNYFLRILRCSLFGQRGNLTTKPNKWQYCVSGPLCCFVLHNLQANQIGLERSVSWLLLWDRITGDMGMSNFIFLLKEEEGFEESRKNTCGLDRWTDRNQRLYKRPSPTWKYCLGPWQLDYFVFCWLCSILLLLLFVSFCIKMKSAMLAVWHFVFETTNFDFTILQLLFH